MSQSKCDFFKVLCISLLLTGAGCTGNLTAKQLIDGTSPDTPATVDASGYKEVVKGDVTEASITLPNGLEVLMMSSPSFTKASAALTARVGSWSEPDDSPGLAHYLEHMLFQGTTDFPDTADYFTYMQSNGGHANASTSDELTNYRFDVPPAAFEGGVRRFSRFFVSPLFSALSSEREKNAVNAEFENDLLNDGWRLHEMMGQMAAAGHPARRFSIGSIKTLANVTPAMLRAFYEAHYSADTMKLTVMSPNSIKEIRTLVEANFLDVPNRHLKGKDISINDKLVAPGRWIEMKPIGSEDKLTLLFSVPNLGVNAAIKPEDVLSRVITDKGPGSLLSLLKKDGLVTDLGFGAWDPASFLGPEGYILIQANLTTKGSAVANQVVGRIFQEIGVVRRKQIQDYSMKEAQIAARKASEISSIKSDYDTAAEYAKEMQRYAALEIDEKSDLITEINPAVVKIYLDSLIPRNVSVIHSFPAAKTDSTLPHFNVAYGETAIDAAQIGEYEHFLSTSNPALSYVAPNPWIADEKTVVFKDESSARPQLLSDDQNGKLWLLQESNSSARAKAFFETRISSPASVASPRNFLLNLIYARAIMNAQAERFSTFSAAGYSVLVTAAPDRLTKNTGLMVGQGGLTIRIIGLSDRMPNVVADLLGSPNNILQAPPLSPEDFANIKELVSREFAARAHQDAFKSARDKIRNFTQTVNISADDYEPELASITLADVQAYANSFRSEVLLKTFVYGNVHQKDYQNTNQDLMKAWGAKALTAAQVAALKQSDMLPPSGQKFAVQTTGENNNNAMVSMITAGPRSPENHAKTNILASLMGSQYFDQLRSKQQLGYIVQATPVSSDSANRIEMMIQSAHYSADEIMKRTDQFLTTFLNVDLPAMLDDKLETVRAGAIDNFVNESPEMTDRFEMMEKVFNAYDGDWNYIPALITALRAVTKDQMAEFAERMLNPKTQSRMTAYFNAEGTPPAPPAPGEVLLKTKDEFIKAITPVVVPAPVVAAPGPAPAPPATP